MCACSAPSRRLLIDCMLASRAFVDASNSWGQTWSKASEASCRSDSDRSETRIGTATALSTSMRTFGLGAALLVSVLILLVIWLIGKAVGFEVSLLGSLGMTVVGTILINVVLAVIARRNRRF